MATLEEKQRELDALQTAFDEYIASSRELEEELDAELTKCQDDLTKAESRNTVLASQLSNIQPQLTSLEAKLSSVAAQLSAESRRRVAAEMKSEEAETKLRESEGTLAAVRSSEVRRLREESEELCERLAFAQGEAEDYRHELDAERERRREEAEELRGDVDALTRRLEEREGEPVRARGDDLVAEEDRVGEGPESFYDGKEAAAGTPPTSAETEPTEASSDEGDGDAGTPPTSAETEPTGASADEREEYVRTLEDELELVTEQLIEAETKLSQTQAELEEALSEAEVAQKALEEGATNGTSSSSGTADQVAELESTVALLEGENAALRGESKRLKEELELALEELALSNEEIKAHEEDNRERRDELDSERKRHKEEIAELKSKLDRRLSDERSRTIEAKSWEESLMASKKETQQFQEEVQRLEAALQNSKADCELLQEEMDELKRAYDETANRERAESEGQHQALEELLATRAREADELKEEVANLTDANSSLTKVLADMEANLEKQQTEMESHQQHVASASESSSQELGEARDEIFALKGLLEASQKELAEQRGEVEKVRSSLQEKISLAQKELSTAEEERERSQAKLLEVETSRSASVSSAACDPSKTVRLSWSHTPLQRSPKDSDGGEGSTPKSDFYRTHALSRRLYSHKSRSRPRSCSPTTIQRLEGDAERRATRASSLEVECNRLEDQNRMSVSMKSHLEGEIKHLQKRLLDATSNERVSSGNEEIVAQDIMMEGDTDMEGVLQSNDPDIIAKEVRAMAKKMSAQKTHNAELLTRILKLQGNIQVCCRIRPMAVHESQNGLHEVAQSLSETEVGCFDERTKLWKSFAFDKVWAPEASQKDVFQDVEPVALSVIDGYNACIFAYGQTGSGKTYTMEGTKAMGKYGINQRMIQRIFALLQDKAQRNERDESSSAQFDYTIEVSMLEIYNDEVYDLLDTGLSSNSSGNSRKKSLDIRHGTDNSVDEEVSSVGEVLSALDRGNSNRAKASTNLNEHSSRSHMILRVEVTSGVGEAKNKASLYLVDLAGSERVRKSEVEGQALKEAQHINKSLSALGNVMEALDRKASHVPYRDSKLTYLLQNSLGGNSRTMMIVTVCPHNNSYDETTFALKFATRVRRINLGSAQKNVTAKNLEETVKNLTSEMSMLSKAKERSESQLLSLKREKERVEEKLSRASASRANSKEEMRTLSILRQTNNDVTSRWQKEKNLREEKVAELSKMQEELQRLQRDLRNVKREQETLSQQNEDKENTIFKLKKDLRTLKEELNEEKIRHRRSQVMQSRIPAPTKGAREANASTRKPLQPQKASGLMQPTSRVNATPKKTDVTTGRDREKHDLNNVACIRYRVLKMLQEHDPKKAERIDTIMSKFEGRETELLEKMITKYESKDVPKPVASTASDTVEPLSTTALDDRPKSRQDMALERHMARMKRIKASGGKG
ncbi:hypothetical protein ACHAWF_014832 [Thalassiosira exigua]